MHQHYTYDISLKALITSIKALVDWVEIKIETTELVSFLVVQRALSRALNLPEKVRLHVTPTTGKSRCVNRHFFVRLHDVESYSDLCQVWKKLSREITLQPGFKVSKVEVAVDVYCADPAYMTATLYRHMTRPVSDNRRLYRDYKGSGRAMPRTSDAIARHVAEGWQIGIGNKGDDWYQHLYLKTSDTLDGKRQDVEPRARVEVRLSGSALPCQTPEDWRNFHFEHLAPWFNFTQERDDLAPWVKAAADASGQVGERKERHHVRNGRVDGVRLYRQSVKADRALNDMMRKALANLSKRWQGSGKRGRVAGATTAESGKTDRISELSDCSVVKQWGRSNNYTYQHSVDTYEQQPQAVTKTDDQPSTTSCASRVKRIGCADSRRPHHQRP